MRYVLWLDTGGNGCINAHTLLLYSSAAWNTQVHAAMLTRTALVGPCYIRADSAVATCSQRQLQSSRSA